jgi:predicted membrane protein
MKKQKAIRPEIQAILDKRETQGLRFSILICIAVVLFWIPGEFAVTSGAVETPIIIALFIVYLGLLGLLLILLRNVKRLPFIGYSITGGLLFMIVVQPFVWYYSVGWTAVPASYLLKTIVPQICFLGIVLGSLPGRPAYPFIITTGAVAMIVIHILLALGDTVNAASRIESACKEKGREFLVSKQVLERSRLNIEAEDLGFIEVKGKNQPLNIFAPRYYQGLR